MILLTRILGEWAMLKGYRVLATETHGMAARGGTVTSHVKIGDYYFPLVTKGKAHAALALHAAEEERAKRYLAPQGILLTNREGRGEEILAINASRMAIEKLGSPVYANLIMLGVMGVRVLNTPKDSLLTAVMRVVGNRHLNENVRALELGYEEACHVTT